MNKFATHLDNFHDPDRSGFALFHATPNDGHV
ncbi:MAG: hypothetical protein ACI8U0_002862 [Flavobacteriales bacterium]|jgi:hypothetical protein